MQVPHIDVYLLWRQRQGPIKKFGFMDVPRNSYIWKYRFSACICSNVAWAGPDSADGCISEGCGLDPRVWQYSIMEKAMKSFLHHSLPTPDSSRAVVSYWQKDVH